jgi:hypothetical protein
LLTVDCRENKKATKQLLLLLLLPRENGVPNSAQYTSEYTAEMGRSLHREVHVKVEVFDVHSFVLACFPFF